MRITGGRAKGIVLESLEQNDLRPATDYMREVVFSALGELVDSVCFLDVFAGTGSYGLEAISRGAKAGVFIENHNKTLQVLKKNLKNVCKSTEIDSVLFSAVKSDALKWQPESNLSFDLIFSDPPYALFSKGLEYPYVSFLAKHEHARLILELPSEQAPPELPGLDLVRHIKKKKKRAPAIAFYANSADSASHE